MYSNYLKERTDKEVLETEQGFAVYSFTQDAVYIEDIFVDKDFRHSNVASDIADKISEIAKSKGFKKMLGSICPSTKNSTEGLKVLLAYGFKLDSSTNNFILFAKDLE